MTDHRFDYQSIQGVMSGRLDDGDGGLDDGYTAITLYNYRGRRFVLESMSNW